MIPPSTSPPNGDRVSPHLDEDVLLDLLLGRVPQAVRSLAMTHLLVCPECENLLRQRGGEVERLRASPVYQALLHERPVPERVEDAVSSPHPAAKKTDGDRASSAAVKIWRELQAKLRRPRFTLVLTTGLAAMAVVVLVVSRPAERVVLPSETDWLRGGSELTDLRGESPRSTGGSLQGPDGLHAGAQDLERGEADLLRAIEAYARRDLGPAIQGLQSARATGPLESIRLIYLGNALAHQGDFAEAARTLRAALQRDLPHAWREEGQWTLMVVLHRTGQRVSADSLFKVLAAEPGEVGDRARALMGKHGSKDYP